MTSSFWRPWEHQEQEPSATDETKITLKIEERGNLSCLKSCKDFC